MIKYTNKAYLKDVSDHNRALAKPMHNITFVGEAQCIATGGIFSRGKAYDAASLRRRAILWASWKGQSTNQLPRDLRDYTVNIVGKVVTFTSLRMVVNNSVAITLPDWPDYMESLLERLKEAQP